MEKMAVKPIYPSPGKADLDPAGLSFLLGNIGRFQFAPKTQYPTHPRPPKAAPDFPASKLRLRVRKSGPPHKLTDQEKNSCQFFSNAGHSLDSDFSADELKFSYHKLALLLHPDRGGYQQDFVDLKFHYDILKKVFTYNS